MPEHASCPFCGAALRPDNLYVRGIAASLHRSELADVGFLSREGLEQIDLRAISRGSIGTQAVIPSLYCDGCGGLSFPSR